MCGTTTRMQIRLSAPTPDTQTTAVRQLVACPTRVASGAPSTMARAEPVNTTPVALPPCPGGARRVAIGATIAQNTPCAIAENTRASESTVRLGEKAASSWATTNTTMVAASNRCRGKRMVSAVIGMVVRAATPA